METSELIIAKKRYFELSELFENYRKIRLDVESLEQEIEEEPDEQLFNALDYIGIFIEVQLNEIIRKFRG